MTVINFGSDAATGFKDEACANLQITGPSGTATLVDVLVDTGADFVMVPQSLARKLGISLRSAKKKTVLGVGGTVIMRLVSGVDVTINGSRAQLDVLFNPSSNSIPLIGRNGIQVIDEIAYKQTRWYWN